MNLLSFARSVGRDIAAARNVVANSKVLEPLTSYDGSGRPVLLLHGFMGHPSSMNRFAELAVGRGCPVMVPQVAPSDSVEYQVANATSILEGFDQPVHMVGHSLGGVISALVSLERPELVASVATVASPLGGSHWARLPVIRQSPLCDVRPGESAARRVTSLSVSGWLRSAPHVLYDSEWGIVRV